MKKRPVLLACRINICIVAAALLATGCATAQPDPNETCGGFNTDLLRADLKNPASRTDSEWYGTLIEILAWQLDCERRSENER